MLGGKPHKRRLGFFCGRLAPQQEHDTLGLFCFPVAIVFGRIVVVCRSLVHGTKDGVCQFLPSLFLVAVRLSLSDRQHVVDQKDTLFGPSLEVSVIWNRRKVGNTGVVLELLVDVPQGRRGLNPATDGETEAVGLFVSVVGILSNDHELSLC